MQIWNKFLLVFFFYLSYFLHLGYNLNIYCVSLQLTWTGLCGGTFQVEGEGTIISPRYPNMYADSLNCKYTLVAPDKVITGRFEDFAIEEANNKGINFVILLISTDYVI